ncbi:MAG: hypothetical protein ACSHW1_15260 [Yoonia sp.]|uniref:hypothetical protein n=1 Tax=Yoonia sp. TaxID=2212373 RepID=UPI003EF78564
MSKYIFSAFLVAVLLTACGSVTPGGLIAASRLDPLETSPSDIIVAVSVPEALRLRDGDAVFRLGFIPEDQSVAEPIDAVVPLTILDGITKPRSAQSGEAIFILGFSAQDAAEIAAVQEQIKTIRAQGVDGSGSLGITIESGCYTSELGDSLEVSTWLRTAPADNFVLLNRSVNLFDVLPPEGRAQLEAKLNRC